MWQALQGIYTDAVSLLLKANANPNLQGIMTGIHVTPLFVATMARHTTVVTPMPIPIS